MTRAISFLFLVAMAAACSEPGVEPVTPAPKLAPAEGEPPADAECTADADCATTALPEAPVTSESDCCFPTCQKRVAPRARVDELQAAFGTTCKAVLCAPQSCADAPEPVAACREWRCVELP